MKIRIIHFIAGALILFAPLSHAAIDISGYATFKAISNVNKEGISYNNLLADTSHTNYDTRESNIGMQFSTDISSKMSATVVMSARGGANKYNFETEWAYLNYTVNDQVSLRFGKVKGPFYMVSDYKDVGYAYPWATPPEEVYSTNPIRSVNGIDLVFQNTVNDVTYLGELYFGSGTNTGYTLPKSVTDGIWTSFGITQIGSQVSFETYNMLGFNASVAYEGISFRAGYFQTKVALGTTKEIDGAFGGIGMTIDMNNIVVYSEYIFRDTSPGLMQFAFPDMNAYYVTAGYRIGDYLPYMTIAKSGPDKSNPSAYVTEQSSTAFGLRVEIDDVTDIKFEAATKNPEGYGLYDAALAADSATLYTIAIDTLF